MLRKKLAIELPAFRAGTGRDQTGSCLSPFDIA